MPYQALVIRESAMLCGGFTPWAGKAFSAREPSAAEVYSPETSMTSSGLSSMLLIPETLLKDATVSLGLAEEEFDSEIDRAALIIQPLAGRYVVDISFIRPGKEPLRGGQQVAMGPTDDPLKSAIASIIRQVAFSSAHVRLACGARRADGAVPTGSDGSALRWHGRRSP